MRYLQLISALAAWTAVGAISSAQSASTGVAASGTTAPQASALAPRSLFDGLDGQRISTFELDEQLDELDRALALPAGGADSSSTRASSALINPALRPQSPQRYRVNLSTSTGVFERVWVQEAASLQARPLLVVFHRFGVSELDAMVSTRYFEEARRRQWFVIAPRSLSQFHFSSLDSQIHTERAITWALANFNVDATRIYAVGFSMGGGAALNYAARHLDLDEPRFAAVATLSGLLDHEHAYANEILATQQLYDSVFGTGAPGSANNWLMRRSGLFRVDPLLMQVVPGTDLARNLAHVNVHLFRANGDIPYLSLQHDVLAAHLASLPLVSAQHQAAVSSYVGHSWDAVDERQVCAWLRQFQLTTPSAANTLADEDGAYFHFELEQDAPGAFSPFSWAVDAQANSLTLTGTGNVQRITVRTNSAGLSAAAPLQVSLAAADGFADEVVLEDWPLAPLQVLRDGAPSSGWLHDSLNGRLTLFETDPALHVWQIAP